MTAADVAEWKKKLLDPIQEKIRRAASAQSGVSLRAPTRLAVGHSVHGKERHLELRVVKQDGPAWRKAQEVREKYPKEVNVAVVESVEVAPISAVLAHDPYSKLPTESESPLCLGSSVSHLDASAPGSLGGFVQDKDGEVAILSCSHILALGGGAKKGSPVVHPGRGDIGQVFDENLIGQLTRFAVLAKGGANALDAAYANLDENTAYDGNTIPDRLGAPQDAVGRHVRFDPNVTLGEDEPLAKVGRTSGYTEGILSAVGVDNVSVTVSGIGLVHFDNCIEVRWKAVNQPFTKPGDSGSLVFTAAGRAAVGIHFARGLASRDGTQFNVSYSCELAAILSAFRLTWLDQS